MLFPLQPSCFKLLACAMALIAATGQVLRANADANPYASIVERNPFGLKPPAPPALPPEPPAPPLILAKVTLTGLLSSFGEPRALLEIIEEPGKGGGTPKRPPPMREGERLGPVEILGIDVVKNTVRLRNSGIETNITFEVAKTAPTPGGPGVPGAPSAFTPPILSAPQPHQPPPGQPAPTVISANNANPGGGVTLMGGASANPAAAVPAVLGSIDAGGTRTIPSRLLEATRLRGGSPAPPAISGR